MIHLVALFMLTTVIAACVAQYHANRASNLAQRIAAHRAAAAAYIVEVRKLERRAAYLERKRAFVTRRAWAKRSGYRTLGRWQVLP